MKDWSLLGSYTNGFEVWRVRSILEAAGIPIWIENEHSQSVWGAGLLSCFPINPAVGPLRVWIPIHATERAKHLLSTLD